MVGISVEHTTVCIFGGIVLWTCQLWPMIRYTHTTYIFLLLVYVANLEPNVFLSQRFGRILHDVCEALLDNISSLAAWVFSIRQLTSRL